MAKFSFYNECNRESENLRMVAFMEVSQKMKEDLIFMSEVSKEENNTDFHVEVFTYSSDLKCDGSPVKVIHNFDDLINFFENDEEKN